MLLRHFFEKSDSSSRMHYPYIYALIFGSVVQLDRMTVSGTVGCGFESRRGHTEVEKPFRHSSGRLLHFSVSAV